MKIVAFRRCFLLGACLFAAVTASAQKISPTYELLAYTSLLSNAPSGSNAPTGGNDCSPPTGNNYRSSYANQQVIYVSQGGDDNTGAGTYANPYQSGKKAVSELNNSGYGQLVCFETGTYQPFTIYKSGGGLDNMLRFEVIPGETATIDLTCNNQADTSCNGAPPSAGITIQPLSVPGEPPSLRVSYVLVSGFYVHGPDDYLKPIPNIFNIVAADPYNPYYNAPCIAIIGNQNGAYFVPGQEADHIYIVANTLEGCSGGGISANFSDYLTIDGNTVSNTDYYGAYASSAISVYESVDTYPNDPSFPSHMYKNYVVNNTVFSNFEYEPVPSSGKVTDGEGIIIDTNMNSAAGTVFNPAGGDACSYPYVGTYCLPPYSGYTLVSNNQIWGNGGAAIQTTLSQNVDITFNSTCNNDINYNNYTPYSEVGRGEIEIYDSLNINVDSNIISTSAYDVGLMQFYQYIPAADSYLSEHSSLLPLISFNDNTSFDSLSRVNVYAPSPPAQLTNDNGHTEFLFTGGAYAYAIDQNVGDYAAGESSIGYAAGEYSIDSHTIYQNGGLNLAATTDSTIQNSTLFMGLTTDILGVTRQNLYGIVSAGAFYVPQ